MSETEKIRERYETRKRKAAEQPANPGAARYSECIVEERERVYEKILRAHFPELSKIKVLEIGAGSGGNLSFFLELGIPAASITANELLADRFEALKKNHPGIHAVQGDASQLPYEEEFDVVFQSTVFTSILDENFRRTLAQRMLAMTRPGGLVLWYDFLFDNPSNPDVKKVTKREVRSLFAPAKSFEFHRVTLAPPIGRRFSGLYGFLNAFPFLRTHLIAAIRK